MTLGLVIHAMNQACGYIRKKIMDLTHKKQVVKYRLNQLVFLHCDTAVDLETFFGMSRSCDLTSCGHPYRFHQNRPSFIEDITKHLVSFFGHSVDAFSRSSLICTSRIHRSLFFYSSSCKTRTLTRTRNSGLTAPNPKSWV